MDKIKIGQLISKHRKIMNLTQNELAKKLDVSSTTVTKWESGENCPGLDMLKELSIILRIQIENLIDVANSSFGIYEVLSDDAEILFRKNNCYSKYIEILTFRNVDEKLLITCILNDYFQNYKKEMTSNISNRLKHNTYVKTSYTDAVLALHTSLEAAKSTISSSNLCTVESIDEAKFNVTIVEDALIDLMFNYGYSVNEYELEDYHYYNKIYKYLIIKSNMRKSLYNFNIYDINLAYKKNLTKLHSLYFDLINKYLIDDFVVKDNEKIYVKDYDKCEIIGEFRDSICIVDNEINKALKDFSNFNDKEIINAMENMGFLSAMLTNCDQIGY